MNKITRLFCTTCFGLSSALAFGQSWSMKQATIMSPFAATVDTSNVLGEYPRPQMVREKWMNLNGIWQFQPGTSLTETLPDGKLSSKILVPFPVESAISGVMTHYDKLWYRRTFTVPQDWAGKRVLLHFDAVDYQTEVFVNGTSLGIHKGGYDPFVYDVTSYLTGTGPQDLTVRVYDPTDDGGQPRGKQTLNPQGIMYTCSSGIWQSVWLEPVAQTYISKIKLVPNIDKSILTLNTTLSGATTNMSVSVVVKDGDKVVSTLDGAVNTNLVIPVSNAKLWSPDSPFLYDISILLKNNGVVIDSLGSYFGMRKMSMAKVGDYQKMMLNNKFLFQIGPLDQGFWPDGLYTAPTDEALKFDILKMKEFGFNMVRKHIKVERARWYYWCDKLGLMVWQDMPSPNSYTAVTPAVDKVAFFNEMKKMVENHWNSPSIIMWVIFNESQAQHDTKFNVKTVMNMDSTRLVNQASGGSWEGVGHVLDVHQYPAPGCPTSTTQTLACGEYGGIGLKVTNHIWNPDNLFGYMWVNNGSELASKYNEFQESLMLFKSNRGLSAAVYTEITDVEMELNGLVTYDRKVTKADASLIYQSNYMAIHQNQFLTSILPSADIAPQTWQYTFNTPASTWYTKTFNDAAWLSGFSGFGTANTPGGIITTTWDTNDIWMRKKFQLGTISSEYMDSIKLYIHHDEGCEVYINNVLTATLTGYTGAYVTVDLSQAVKNALIIGGENTIAIHCHQTTGGQYIDAGLILKTNGLLPVVDVKNIKFDQSCFYPNPVKDQIHFSGLGNSFKSVEVYTSLGVLVLQTEVSGETVDVSGLSEGLYLLQVRSEKRNKSFKFKKEK